MNFGLCLYGDIYFRNMEIKKIHNVMYDFFDKRN